MEETRAAWGKLSYSGQHEGMWTLGAEAVQRHLG